MTAVAATHRTKRKWASISEEGRHFTVVIADNGKGIPDDAKERLFNVSERSGGVSLNVVRDLLKLAGTELRVGGRVPSD